MGTTASNFENKAFVHTVDFVHGHSHTETHPTKPLANLEKKKQP